MDPKATKIGLEIHVPLRTEKKLFCDCPTSYHEIDTPNSLICEICTGMPGIKPMPINSKALDAVIIIAHLLNCTIPRKRIYMKRKHYDYPDLPKGYQITSEPIGVDGVFRFDGGQFPDIGIWEVHLEEDPGQYNLAKGLVDYNRSGVPLVEIVTAPDIQDPEHARSFMKDLLKMLEYSDLILEGTGIIRADVNVSVAGGNRVEVKNVNSIRSIYRAIKYEILRQEALLSRGRVIEQETRGWDEERGETYTLRKKESAEDYRYIPDPDLPPILLGEEYISKMRELLPETPQDIRQRFISKYGISEKYARVLTNNRDIARFFENLATKVDPPLLATWVCEELLAQLNYRGISLSETKITEQNFYELISLLSSAAITEATAKKLLERIVDSGESPREVVEAEGLGAIKDDGSLERVVEEVIEENPGPISDYRSGKTEALNFLMGQVMRRMRGRADAKRVSKILRSKLDKS